MTTGVTLDQPVRPRHLLRSLEASDLQRYVRGHDMLSGIDGFIVSQSIPRVEAEPVLAKLVGLGARMFRYVNLLQMPREEWLDPPGQNPWFDWVGSYPPAGPLTAPDGSTPRTPWYGQTKMWAWPRCGRLEREEIRRTLYDLSAPAGWGIFLDQFWLEPRWWMFREPEVYRTFDPVLWQAWRFNILAFVAEMRLVDNRMVLVNGENAAPPPCYFERADWTIEATWPEHLKLWRSHPDSVLSVHASATWAVQLAIEEWMQTGGWLAFGGDDDASLDRAYGAAVRRRRPGVGTT